MPAEPSVSAPAASDGVVSAVTAPRRVSLIRCIPMIVGAASITLLALRSHPSFADVPRMPHGLVQLLDASDFLNHVVGFGVFTLTVHFAFARPDVDTFWSLLARASGIALFAVVLEALQQLLPHRSCDLRDVAAGLIGIVLASLPWSRRRRLLRDVS